MDQGDDKGKAGRRAIFEKAWRDLGIVDIEIDLDAIPEVVAVIDGTMTADEAIASMTEQARRAATRMERPAPARP